MQTIREVPSHLFQEGNIFLCPRTWKTHTLHFTANLMHGEHVIWYIHSNLIIIRLQKNNSHVRYLTISQWKEWGLVMAIQTSYNFSPACPVSVFPRLFSMKVLQYHFESPEITYALQHLWWRKRSNYQRLNFSSSKQKARKINLWFNWEALLAYFSFAEHPCYAWNTVLYLLTRDIMSCIQCQCVVLCYYYYFTNEESTKWFLKAPRLQETQL